jgi:peptide deformylase
MTAEFHFAEDTLPLQLFLQRFEGLVDVVIADENLHLAAHSYGWGLRENGIKKTCRAARRTGAARKGAPIATLFDLAKFFFRQHARPMAILKIARMGHPVLLRRAEPVPDPTAPEIARLIADMIETMLDAGGVGLAAPQVHVSLRLFVYRLPESRVENAAACLPPTALINPEIMPLDDERVPGWEGCLSIPGLRASVPRAPRIEVRALDATGAPRRFAAEGFHARVLQHENDHLDGILYPMRMTDFSRFGFEAEIDRYAAEL